MKRRSVLCTLTVTLTCTASMFLSPFMSSVGAASPTIAGTLPEPSVAVGGQVQSSSCVAGPVCVSVGWNHHGNTGYSWAARWHDHEWSKLPAPPGDPGGGSSSTISCSSSTWCMATGSTGIGPGNHPIADELIGSNWTSLPVPTPKGSTDFSLYKLDCKSSTWCIAVGSYVANKTDYVDAQFLTSEVWNGFTWRIVTIFSPRTYAPQTDPGMVPGGDHPTASPQQLSCVTETFCVVAGFWKGVFVEQWDGHRWSEVTAPNYHWRPQYDSEFSGGACISSTNCLATGGIAVSNGAWRPLIERWNGQKWTIDKLPALPKIFRRGTGFRLTQVECVTSNFCVAFGDPGFASATLNAMKWNGRTWTYITISGSRAKPAFLCLTNSECNLID
jgi:hypothetical protein